MKFVRVCPFCNEEVIDIDKEFCRCPNEDCESYENYIAKEDCKLVRAWEG